MEDANETYAERVLLICQEKLRTFEELENFVSSFLKKIFPMTGVV